MNDLVIKAFSAARGYGQDGPPNSASIGEFVSAISSFFGSDSYIPIIRDSRQARKDLVNTDGTGLR